MRLRPSAQAERHAAQDGDGRREEEGAGGVEHVRAEGGPAHEHGQAGYGGGGGCQRDLTGGQVRGLP